LQRKIIGRRSDPGSISRCFWASTLLKFATSDDRPFGRSGSNVGLGRFFRRNITKPLGRQIDTQSELLCEMHIRQLMAAPPYDSPKRLERYGYRSFSQNDEDGIVEEILQRIGPGGRTFVEFGVGNGRENNTRLLLYRGGRGLWIEGDPRFAKQIRRDFRAELEKNQLQVLESMVTRDNINALIAAAKLEEIDLLSIDIDGNDYWIWEAIEVRPRVVAIEYNAKFRPPTQWVMEYSPAHRWESGDYHGAALQSLSDLGRAKGYSLVGCCLAGVNAFFVRDDLVQGRFAESDAAALYNPPRFYLRTFLSAGHPAVPFGPYRSI
jgi:hypothetical protein